MTEDTPAETIEKHRELIAGALRVAADEARGADEPRRLVADGDELATLEALADQLADGQELDADQEREPITTFDSATVYYLDDRDADSPTRSEGVSVEIYADWVCLKNPTGTWVPRELVEKVMSI